MALRVVGAGLGRTGTASLKLALERLLGGPCYHMFEVREHEGHGELWRSAIRGEPVDWELLMDGFAACVDWPACAFWRELAAANPEAIVLLSTRDSAATWWASAERTIVPIVRSAVPEGQPELARHRRMIAELLDRRFTPEWDLPGPAIAAYERHNEVVRHEADPGRLLEWQPGEGWEPICSALGVDVPPEPFPHENATADFRARAGLDEQ